MKKVQHAIVNIMEYKNSGTASSAILEATTLKTDASLA